MVLEVSQETFDNAVQENMEILGLSKEEAVEEAIKQFETQGVNLSKLIKNPMSKEEFKEINDSIQALIKLQNENGPTDSVIEILKTLKNYCDEGLPQRVAAGKFGAYAVLLSNYDKFNDNSVKKNTLKTLISLMTTQPDLFDQNGLEFVLRILKDDSQDAETHRLILKLTKVCCVLHEMNRQHIFDAEIVEIIKKFLNEDLPVDVVRESLSLCRVLVLDDDIRVPYGKAHEHARVIAIETMSSLIHLWSKLKMEEQFNLDIMLTLASLMVRDEFCLKFEEAGGLDLIKSAMETFHNNTKVIRQCFKLLKVLARSDKCKAKIMQCNRAAAIFNSLTLSADNPETLAAGLACVAALTIRSPENSRILFNEGAAEFIVQAMQKYPGQKLIQKTGSWAVRNMVSRSKDQSKVFLELGIEAILQESMKQYPDIEYDIKLALRDLGCSVKFKEEWTGKGGALTTGMGKLDINE